MGIRDWAWRRLTAHGRAFDAYEKGHATYEVTLEILQPGYQRTLDEIASVGWRLNRQVTHPRVRTTNVTPRSDGGHDVVKTVTQKATFYFVRDVDPDLAWRPNPAAPPAAAARPAPAPPPVPTWPAGWYQTEHGQQWWDGTRWVAPQPPWPLNDSANYESGYAGFSNGEILLHLTLSFFTCGLWVPVWIHLARSRREGR